MPFATPSSHLSRSVSFPRRSCGWEIRRCSSTPTKRYVGAQIGIYNPSGEKVGQVSHLRNVEYVLVAGPKDVVISMTAPYQGCSTTSWQAPLF